MSLADFLTALLEHGRVSVASAEPSTEEQAAAEAVLVEFERSYRLELPAEPPAFSIKTAALAANVFYAACRFVVERDADVEVIRQSVLIPHPEPVVASTHYSADVVLRFLPDAVKLARAAAPDDPLVDVLLQLGSAWPLSSVGIEGVSEVDAAVIVADDGLRQLYVDRWGIFSVALAEKT